MQTGTGTFDVLPGIFYGGSLGQWYWGLSYRARLPLGVNPEGYMWGNYQEANGWIGYSGFRALRRPSASAAAYKTISLAPIP